MPQKLPGRLAMTFPDRLPYGESVAFQMPSYACTRFLEAQLRAPLGLEKEF